MICQLNCSVSPAYVVVDDDISGLGVVTGFVGTAGLAVVIVIAYYLLAFRPELDPLRNEDGQNHPIRTIPYTPNSFDALIWRLRTRVAGKLSMDLATMDKREKVLIRCLLTMSDIQIMTGLAILISGYTQLCSGIAACHWHIVIYLAWFSSLTHLSCLTLLRNFLHRRPRQRTWRLSAMLIIVILLLTAIGSTGNYMLSFFTYHDWVASTPDQERELVTGNQLITPASYAVCHFYSSHKHVGEYEEYGVAFMALTILIISISFLSRVIKSTGRLSGKFAQLDQALTQKVRSGLYRVRRRATRRSNGLTPMRTLIYWPFLMVFLMWRVFIECMTALAMEIWWLVFSFLWGTLRLRSGLSLCAREEQKWSFGQTMPVLLLLAPLVSFWQHIASNKDGCDEATSPAAPVGAPDASTVGYQPDASIRHPSGSEAAQGYDITSSDDPFHRFDASNSFLNDTRIFFFLVIIMISTSFLVFYGSGRSPIGIVQFWTVGEVQIIWNMVPINAFLWTYNFLLLRFQLALVMDAHANRPTTRAAIRSCFLLGFTGLFVCCMLPVFQIMLYIMAGLAWVPSIGHLIYWGGRACFRKGPSSISGDAGYCEPSELPE